MLKKSITYKNLDGEDITGDFYFHLSEADIAEMELEAKGGLETHLRKIVAEENRAEIIAAFKNIIGKAYGRRNEDGVRFEKSSEITKAFMETDAYSVLFISFFRDANSLTEFVKGCLPKSVVERINAAPAALEQADVPLPAKKKDLVEYSMEELVQLPKSELERLIRDTKGNVPKEVLLLALRMSS
jgi:hypothetical protein